MTESYDLITALFSGSTFILVVVGNVMQARRDALQTRRDTLQTDRDKLQIAMDKRRCEIRDMQHEEIMIEVRRLGRHGMGGVEHVQHAGPAEDNGGYGSNDSGNSGSSRSATERHVQAAGELRTFRVAVTPVRRSDSGGGTFSTNSAHDDSQTVGGGTAEHAHVGGSSTPPAYDDVCEPPVEKRPEASPVAASGCGPGDGNVMMPSEGKAWVIAW